MGILSNQLSIIALVGIYPTKANTPQVHPKVQGHVGG